MKCCRFCCLLLIVTAPAGCAKRSDGELAKSQPPATVSAPVKELDLTLVHLTPEAERRLGIELSPVERKPMNLSQMLGGTICVSQGGTISIAAPLSGTLLATDKGFPRPGTFVKSQQKLLKLTPVFAGQQEVLAASDRLSLEKTKADLAASRAEAEGQVAAAEVLLQAAKAQLDRTDRLRREKVGSEKAYEEALANSGKAQADLAAAKARLQILRNIQLEMQPGSAPALEIGAPIDGVVTALHVRSGMEVSSGAPLIDIIATNPIWVRVPVYAGQLDSVDLSAAARVHRLGAPGGGPGVTAQRVASAPMANAVAATVDLFFELPNPDLQWKPDERVVTRIPFKQSGEVLTVPWSAIVYDVHGGSWIYAKTAPFTYSRQRVEMREIVDGLAILARGPAPGTSIVTAGAAELFGTEFGAGK